MTARDQPRHVDIRANPALVRLVTEVNDAGRPAVLYDGAEELAVLIPTRRPQNEFASPALADPGDIWARYDPARVKQALIESAGALRGLDRDEFVADLAEQRQQDSSGRPEEA